MISCLPFDLVEEILSRLPLISLRTVLSTCKQWNALSKDRSFMKKHTSLVRVSHRDKSTRFSLHNTKDLPSIKEIGGILCPVDIYEFCQCDGLFLCAASKEPRLIVWNPYLGQTKSIKVKLLSPLQEMCTHAIGYDNNNNHKVLRVVYIFAKQIVDYEIYNFKSNLWRVGGSREVVSFKGNAYFFCRDSSEDFINVTLVICFDFTTERFGPRLPLPFHSAYPDSVVASCVRDQEQLAVLHHKCKYPSELEIWIATKIEPNAISWSKFFKADMEPLDKFKPPNFTYWMQARSFFINNKKKVAVVFERGNEYDKSYMIGEDGKYEEIGFEGNVFSYVPSSSLIQQKIKPSVSCITSFLFKGCFI